MSSRTTPSWIWTRELENVLIHLLISFLSSQLTLQVRCVSEEWEEPRRKGIQELFVNAALELQILLRTGRKGRRRRKVREEGREKGVGDTHGRTKEKKKMQLHPEKKKKKRKVHF